MVVFPDSHVDLMGNITFTQEQLMRRWNRELLRKYSKITQDNLRDLKQIIDSVPEGTSPNTQENRDLLLAFETDKLTTYTRRLDDEKENAKLIAAIEYEKGNTAGASQEVIDLVAQRAA